MQIYKLLADEVDKFAPPDCKKKIIIYGIGILGLYRLLLLLTLGKKVSYIVDADEAKHGKNICGIEVKSPYDLLYEDWENILVFVCIGKGWEKVAEMLDGMGGILNQNYYIFEMIANRNCAEPADKIDPILGYSRGTENSFQEMLLHDRKITQIEKNNGQRILTLGGSTTDYSTYWIKSWPMILKQLIHSHGMNSRVINGGVIGYNSSQELLKLIRDALEEVKPDMVISYSGINDSFPSKYSLTCDTFVDTITVMREYYQNNVGSIDEIDFGIPLKDNVKRYIQNLRIMHAICEEFGIKFIGIVQPAMYLENYAKSSVEEEYFASELVQERIKPLNSFYKEVCNAIKEYSYMYDFTSIFDGVEDVYYDWVHCTEKGNRIIAENVYRILETL